MNLVLPRVLTAVVLLLLGTLAGWLAGSLAGWPVAGAASGALLFAAAAASVDATRAHRLMAWLRDANDLPAPRGTRLWGELGYRFERVLRLGQRQAQAERDRLAKFLSAIEASPNGVMMLDANEQIAWWSAAPAQHQQHQFSRHRRSGAGH